MVEANIGPKLSDSVTTDCWNLSQNYHILLKVLLLKSLLGRDFKLGLR